MEVPPGDDEAEALAGAEDRGRRTQRDGHFEFLVVRDRLEVLEGVFGLMGCAAGAVEFAKREA